MIIIIIMPLEESSGRLVQYESADSSNGRLLSRSYRTAGKYNHDDDDLDDDHDDRDHDHDSDDHDEEFSNLRSGIKLGFQ